MNNPSILRRYRDQIEQAIAASIRGDGALYSILRYHMGIEGDRAGKASGMGKLLRPCLVLFTAGELGCNPRQVLPAAVALELIHNFSLVHDDIQDEDSVRRGQLAVWKRFGVAQAINAGDLLQALGFGKALDAGAATASTLTEAVVEMIEGQELDISFQGRSVGLDSYMKMIDKKTGALIRCAFIMGGQAAGVGGTVLAELGELGVELGRAFQIRDDLLGVWGEGERTGKPQGSDILRKKSSLPVAIALEKAEGEKLRIIIDAYARESIGKADIVEVVAVMDSLGVRDAAERRLAEHLDRARASLERLPFSQNGQEEMRELIEYMAVREQ